MPISEAVLVLIESVMTVVERPTCISPTAVARRCCFEHVYPDQILVQGADSKKKSPSRFFTVAVTVAVTVAATADRQDTTPDTPGGAKRGSWGSSQRRVQSSHLSITTAQDVLLQLSQPCQMAVSRAARGCMWLLLGPAGGVAPSARTMWPGSSPDINCIQQQHRIKERG